MLVFVFVGIHGNTELVAALKLLVCANPKLTTLFVAIFNCDNFKFSQLKVASLRAPLISYGNYIEI